VNAAIFEPRFEVMKNALINKGIFSAASLIFEFLKEHRTGDCMVCAADFSLMSLGFWREAWPVSGQLAGSVACA
jgi:hypothetical protein